VDVWTPEWLEVFGRMPQDLLDLTPGQLTACAEYLQRRKQMG